MRATRAPDGQSWAASMTVHTVLDMSSIRRSVDLATRGDRRERSSSLSSSWPEEEGEREIASVRRVVLHSRMASIASRKKSVGRMQEAGQAEEGGAASAGLAAASIRTTSPRSVPSVLISRTTATATTTTTAAAAATTGRSHHWRTDAGALPPAVRSDMGGDDDVRRCRTSLTRSATRSKIPAPTRRGRRRRSAAEDGLECRSMQRCLWSMPKLFMAQLSHTPLAYLLSLSTIHK